MVHLVPDSHNSYVTEQIRNMRKEGEWQMILQKEYLDDVKEHIKGMDETEFTKRETTKERLQKRLF